VSIGGDDGSNDGSDNSHIPLACLSSFYGFLPLLTQKYRLYNHAGSAFCFCIYLLNQSYQVRFYLHHQIKFIKDYLTLMFNISIILLINSVKTSRTPCNPRQSTQRIKGSNNLLIKLSISVTTNTRLQNRA